MQVSVVMGGRRILLAVMLNSESWILILGASSSLARIPSDLHFKARHPQQQKKCIHVLGECRQWKRCYALYLVVSLIIVENEYYFEIFFSFSLYYSDRGVAKSVSKGYMIDSKCSKYNRD